MDNNIFFSLPSNLLIKFNYLKQDFIEFNLGFEFLQTAILGFLISLFIITVSLLAGRKIRKWILKNHKILNYSFLIDISLGYILFATGIGIIGILSLLTPQILYTYIFIFSILSFYPFKGIAMLPQEIKKTVSRIKKDLNLNKFISIWIILFVSLALINLINPETREDQYHVDVPNIFLQNQTTLIYPDQAQYAPLPMLSEMTYLVGIFLWSNESSRYIHFVFYILVLLTLVEFSKLENYKFSKYAPLLFVTAPVVIHETSSMYVDFQWMLFFLLSIFLLVRKKFITYQTVLLSGVFLGAMIASKIWTIVFFPVSVIYLIYVLNKIDKKILLKYILVLFSAALSVSLIWYFRSYLLTGNPLYPAFTENDTLKISFFSTILNYIHINYSILNPLYYINVFSPLFFLGCLLFFYKFKNNLKLFIKPNIFKYFVLLFLLYLFINYPYGRYLLGLYLLFIFFASVGISSFVSSFKYSKLILNFLLFILFSYYFINSILVLPYSLGIADKNKYLTRILSRDNSSYYDFGKKFDKYISKEDFVATYNIFGYYYANFRFLDVHFILDKNNRNFDLLKEKGITKIFIKDYSMEEFCKRTKLKYCDSSKYTLLSSYNKFPNYYLYSIK